MVNVFQQRVLAFLSLRFDAFNCLRRMFSSGDNHRTYLVVGRKGGKLALFIASRSSQMFLMDRSKVAFIEELFIASPHFLLFFSKSR